MAKKTSGYSSLTDEQQGMFDTWSRQPQNTGKSVDDWKVARQAALDSKDAKPKSIVVSIGGVAAVAPTVEETVELLDQAKEAVG